MSAAAPVLPGEHESVRPGPPSHVVERRPLGGLSFLALAGLLAASCRAPANDARAEPPPVQQDDSQPRAEEDEPPAQEEAAEPPAPEPTEQEPTEQEPVQEPVQEPDPSQDEPTELEQAAHEQAEQEPAGPSDAALERAAGDAFPLHGQLRTRYRFRATQHENDHDLESVLTLDAGDARRHDVTAHVSLWANADLDESGGGTEPDPFFDLSDTHDSGLTARLYQGYVDAARAADLDVLRLGRQPLDDMPEVVTFDGLRVETHELGRRAWRAGAYGGVPTHLFESSPEGDVVYGTFLEARPWNALRARVDWMHLEDDDLLAEHDNDLLAARAWHAAGRLRVNAGYSWLEGESRDATGTVNWYDSELDLQLQGSYYQLLETQKDLATEVDPFFEALFEHFPFVRARVLAIKGFAERYRVELGSELRQLVDEDDEGEFNREYDRHHAQLEIDRLAGQPLTLALTGELWDADGGAVTSWSADLTREWEQRWRTSIGSYFALYELDLFTLDERQDVRVYYLDVRYDWSRNVRLQLAYEFENDDFDEYHALRTGVSWHF